MKLKKILSALLASSLILSVAGCSNGNTSSTASTTEGTTTAAPSDTSAPADTDSSADTEAPALDGNGATLTVLTHRTDMKEDGSLAEMTKAFEEKFNCKVEYQAFTDYASDVSTMMSTDNYGDVLMIPDTVELKDLHLYFEPLGSFDELNKTYQWTETKMFDNVVYGLASAGNVAGGILYNKEVWEAAGITEMPKSTDEFLADLQLIADKTEAIPYYTNFADSWCIVQWAGLVVSASGDPSYETNILQNKSDLFVENGDGYYKVYKLLYDIYKNPEFVETDHNTTDWEGSKIALVEGNIGAMVLGSWAVSQFQQVATDNGIDPSIVGFMPFPNEVNGAVNAQIAADYSLGVNIHSANKELGKAYVEWFVGDSGYAQKGGAIGCKIGSELPDYLDAFEGVNFFTATVPPTELVGKFNEVDLGSGVGTWQDDTNNFKIKLAEAAFSSGTDDDFNAIIADVNAKWNASRAEILGE